MGTISELNLRPFSDYFQRDGKSEGITPAVMAQDNFQYILKLLKIKSAGERETEAEDSSGMQAMIAARSLARKGTGKVKIPSKMLDWQEKET